LRKQNSLGNELIVIGYWSHATRNLHVVGSTRKLVRKVPRQQRHKEIKLGVVYDFLFTGGYYCFPLPCPCSLLLLCFRFLLLSALVPVFVALFCYLPSGLLLYPVA